MGEGEEVAGLHLLDDAERMEFVLDVFHAPLGAYDRDGVDVDASGGGGVRLL